MDEAILTAKKSVEIALEGYNAFNRFAGMEADERRLCWSENGEVSEFSESLHLFNNLGYYAEFECHCEKEYALSHGGSYAPTSYEPVSESYNAVLVRVLDKNDEEITVTDAERIYLEHQAEEFLYTLLN